MEQPVPDEKGRIDPRCIPYSEKEIGQMGDDPDQQLELLARYGDELLLGWRVPTTHGG